jgi:phosphatidylglycerophosphate synthase
VGLNRVGVVFGVAYLVLGVLWVALTDPGPPYPLVGWFAAVAAFGCFIPGIANQVSLARAYLAAPAIAYALTPGRLGFLALVLAVGGLTDLVDGTIARRFDRPSKFGGGLDPVVDGILLGAVAIGLALGGIFPLWLAAVIVARYLVPAVVGLLLISMHRRVELRHTLSGQVSTALIIVLVGGLCLFRFMSQDASNVVVGAEIVIPVTTAAAFAHLGWVAWRSMAARAA